MALRQLFPTLLLPHAIAFPAATSPLRTNTAPLLGHILRPVLQLSFTIPTVTRFDVPSILDGLWESILRAVPKKKTSHRKKRQRFMAGKALKDVTALNKCSACGNVKRAHLLCPFCVNGPSRLVYSEFVKLIFYRDPRHVGQEGIRRVGGEDSSGGRIMQTCT